MMACVNAAIQVFETNYADNFTINMTFKVDTNVGLAQSLNSYANVNYSDYRAALQNKATSANDFLALSQLPNTATDPVLGSNQMLITVPLANMLGLSTQTPSPLISFNTNLFSFTRPDPNGNNIYDMQSAAEHEMDEILGGGGAGCNIGSFALIGALDLFRYATNSTNATLARTWTTNNGDNAYFSVDGTNLWARFNMTPGGDLGDFYGVDYDTNSGLPVYWAPLGVTPHAEVQDAYGTQSFFSYPTNFLNFPTTNYYYENTAPDLGTNELTMLDVIGWTLATNVTQPTAPTLAIVRNGPGQVKVSWTTNATGYTLQERTNLMAGSWVASASGSANPATIVATNAQKFYRLYHQPVLPSLAPAQLAAIKPLTTEPVLWATHALMPRPH
jgi:hypothetical protein